METEDLFYLRKLATFLGVESETFGQIERNFLVQQQNGNIETGSNGERQTYQPLFFELASNIAAASDRINFQPIQHSEDNHQVTVTHPISGQRQTISTDNRTALEIPQKILQSGSAKTIYWWVWRFYPEKLAQQNQDFWLYPSHTPLPDCPEHSFLSTTAALTGSLCPKGWQSDQPHKRPYLLVFSFSPVQELIKASRKFVDFWSGSYILHYLSASVCWEVAQQYGPDAVITPSLLGQEIVDAWLVREHPDWQQYFPNRENFDSVSLRTAGFPNAIAILVPSSEVQQAANRLQKTLRTTWQKIAENVRDRIRSDIKDYLAEKAQNNFEDCFYKYQSQDPASDLRDLQKWQQESCWQWRKLWETQIQNTWQTYWAALPLGHPEQSFAINGSSPNWEVAQQRLTGTPTIQPVSSLLQKPANISILQPIPSTFEREIYTSFNVGSWWGSLQQRLREAMELVKNARTWQYGAAPGNRSTLSGQRSALHPSLNYQQEKREGAGLPAGSLRLFWHVMAQCYTGLFNGSEQLNAIELTKRMAWRYGGVAESCGVRIEETEETEETSEAEEKDEKNAIVKYEKLVRFPNLTSIAAARFLYRDFTDNNGEKTKDYWNTLNQDLRKYDKKLRNRFGGRTRGRPTQIPKTDAAVNQPATKGEDRNGVMFDSKWLADDLGLEKQDESIDQLRASVEQAHKENGFTEFSPSDWWAIVLADGDGMGNYIDGSKLDTYSRYVVEEQIDANQKQQSGFDDLLHKTNKRMGPATHVGFNRALVDFSNRIVPYITEERFCGRVVYSGGDDVMVVLPLEDVPEFLLSLRAAWCGGTDPVPEPEFQSQGGYWLPNAPKGSKLPQRPLFTMGEGATMSAGVVVAHKSVPLPTVLENLWAAEGDRAKKIVGKDGLCVRTIYGSGNTLEFVTKGNLLPHWWELTRHYAENSQESENLDSLLHRLAEELPRRASFTESDRLFRLAAQAIISRRERNLSGEVKNNLLAWLDEWENWAKETRKEVMLHTTAVFLADKQQAYLQAQDIDWSSFSEQINTSFFAYPIPEEWLSELRSELQQANASNPDRATILQAVAIVFSNKYAAQLRAANIHWTYLPERMQESGLAAHIPVAEWVSDLQSQLRRDLDKTLGVHPQDLGKWLRFSAFWTNEMRHRENIWRAYDKQPSQ